MPILLLSGASLLEKTKQSATNDGIFWRGKKKIHTGADGNQKIDLHRPYVDYKGVAISDLIMTVSKYVFMLFRL